MKTNSNTNLHAEEGFTLNFMSIEEEMLLEDIQASAQKKWPKDEFLKLNNSAKARILTLPRNTADDLGSMSPFVFSDVRLWITEIARLYVDALLCVRVKNENTRGVPYYLPKVTHLHFIDVSLFPYSSVLFDDDVASLKMTTSKLATGRFVVIPVPIRIYFDTGRVSIRPIKDKANFGIGYKSRDEMFDILFACLAAISATRDVKRSRRKVYDLVRLAALCTGFTHVLASSEVGHERAMWASIFDTLLFHRLMELDWAMEIFHTQSTAH